MPYLRVPAVVSQEAVQLLLGHGSNVKAAAMDDMNALHFAAQKGHVEPIRLLVNAGKNTVEYFFYIAR